MLIARHDRRPRRRVLDPFCGTATTALSAAYHGHEGITTDINPFLVWFGGVKTARYSGAAIASTRDAGARVMEAVGRGTFDPVEPPPIHNIDRWWCQEALESCAGPIIRAPAPYSPVHDRSAAGQEAQPIDPAGRLAPLLLSLWAVHFCTSLFVADCMAENVRKGDWDFER